MVEFGDSLGSLPKPWAFNSLAFIDILSPQPTSGANVITSHNKTLALFADSLSLRRMVLHPNEYFRTLRLGAQIRLYRPVCRVGEDRPLES